MVESWASSSGVRASMRSNKGRDTKPEKALRTALHALGLRYRASTRPIKDLRRTADLVFTKLRIAVFLDGCFWHGCPEHHTVAATNPEFWANKVRDTRARDRDTDRKLAEAGWLSIRVWEHEDPETAAKRILAVVVARRMGILGAPDSSHRDRPAADDLIRNSPTTDRPADA